MSDARGRSQENDGGGPKVDGQETQTLLEGLTLTGDQLAYEEGDLGMTIKLPKGFGQRLLDLASQGEDRDHLALDLAGILTDFLSHLYAAIEVAGDIDDLCDFSRAFKTVVEHLAVLTDAYRRSRMAEHEPDQVVQATTVTEENIDEICAGLSPSGAAALRSMYDRQKQRKAGPPEQSTSPGSRQGRAWAGAADGLDGLGSAGGGNFWSLEIGAREARRVDESGRAKPRVGRMTVDFDDLPFAVRTVIRRLQQL